MNLQNQIRTGDALLHRANRNQTDQGEIKRARIKLDLNVEY